MCDINVIIYSTFGIVCSCYTVSKECYFIAIHVTIIREGSIILLKYASKVVPLKVVLGAIDNNDH